MGKFLPEGTRKNFESTEFDPAEYIRVVVGQANKPKQDQRYIVVNKSKIDLPIAQYECDFCSKMIYPGDKCAGLSVWIEGNLEPAPWEHDYLNLPIEGQHRNGS